MSASTALAAKKPSVDESRIGELSAQQPLSGVSIVTESLAVNGLGHGAYLRQDDNKEKRKA